MTIEERKVIENLSKKFGKDVNLGQLLEANYYVLRIKKERPIDISASLKDVLFCIFSVPDATYSSGKDDVNYQYGTIVEILSGCVGWSTFNDTDIAMGEILTEKQISTIADFLLGKRIGLFIPIEYYSTREVSKEELVDYLKNLQVNKTKFDEDAVDSIESILKFSKRDLSYCSKDFLATLENDK